MTTERVRIFKRVCTELDERKARGFEVPKLAYTIAASEAHEMHATGMEVSEISAFCISMAGVERCRT
jgi:hypothetical protein